MKNMHGMILSFICSMACLMTQVTCADIFVYKDASGILYLTNKKDRSKPASLIVKDKTRSLAGDQKIDTQKVIRLIDTICLDEGLDPALARAVAKAESGFNQSAVSNKGAIGVMQLMPATADRFNVSDVFSVEDNIRGGVKYLKYLLDLFSKDIRLTVAAYNAGEKRVLDAGGIPQITETINYVDAVIQYYNLYCGKGVCRPIRSFVDEDGAIHLTNF